MTQPYERFGPKYIVEFQVDFDEGWMTPQQAGLEAIRQVTGGKIWAHVTDCETEKTWTMRFDDHVLQVIPTRVCRYDPDLDKMVRVPIKRFDEELQAFVPIEETEEE